MDIKLLLAAAAVYLATTGSHQPVGAQEMISEAESAAKVELRPGVISTYVVRKGDTLRKIADAHGLQLTTLQWANDIVNPDIIKLDQILSLPPVDGVIHDVEEGQTLDAVADLYKIPLEALLEANPDIDDHDGLVPGTRLIVPGGRLQAAPPEEKHVSKPSSAKPQRFLRPVASGRITSRFGIRVHPVSRSKRMHAGLDIAVRTGTPVKACRAGKVILARKAGGYGNLVILDHGNGLTTRYGHNSVLLVKPGQKVARGQVIAKSGSTGVSTGPHLHFEVRKSGRAVNPTPYLKGWIK
ncbi:MAG: M23 family metallopeptidase [bacterium]|nr:M23 family metallopeptidase [bacterium]